LSEKEKNAIDIDRPIYGWEKIVKGLPREDLIVLKNILWIVSLDSPQRARLNFIIHELLEPTEVKDKALGIMPKSEVRRIEEDRLNPGLG
jgi:hypothetical protein